MLDEDHYDLKQTGSHHRIPGSTQLRQERYSEAEEEPTDISDANEESFWFCGLPGVGKRPWAVYCARWGAVHPVIPEGARRSRNWATAGLYRGNA